MAPGQETTTNNLSSCLVARFMRKADGLVLNSLTTSDYDDMSIVIVFVTRQGGNKPLLMSPKDRIS